MNGGEMMVVLIVAIAVIGGIMRKRYRLEDQRAQWMPTPQEDAENRRLREEVKSLRERVQVLERVITDSHSSSSLDREIEKLRDQDRV